MPMVLALLKNILKITSGNVRVAFGNVRVAFGNDGSGFGERQVNAYYPFGMSIRTLSSNSANTVHRNEYGYNGKMYQDEMGLNWYDYGARMYDAPIGRWHVVDPHAENYYAWSPYHYAANNPLIVIDPDGRDWYTSTDGSATMWKKGSAEIEGYKNIGANYTQNIGDHTTVSYTQYTATSMTFTGAEESSFVAQGTGTGCKIASDQMLANEGVNSNGEESML